MAAQNTDDRDDDVPGDVPRELGDDDVASRWADIVATLGDIGGADGHGSAARPDRTAASSQTSGGAADPDSDPDSDTVAGSADDAPRGRRVGGWSDGGWSGGDWTVAPGDETTEPRRPTGPRDWPLTPEAEALEEAESHFTPPEPPPLLSRDPLLTMAWSFVVGVPVLAVIGMIVSAAVPSLDIPPLLGQIGLGLFVAGLGVLVWRMPHQRDPDDDGPGAVV